MVWPAIIAAGATIASALSGERAARKNAALQKEFAQNSLQWKAADARAAGLHPLAALGSQGYSASPVYVGQDFGQLGQDLSRAVSANSTQEERDRLGEFAAQKIQQQDQRDWVREQQAHTRRMNEIELERARMGLQTDQVRYAFNVSQAARQMGAGGQVGPPVPAAVSAGGGLLRGPAGGVTVKPSEVPTTVAGRSAVQQGVLPASQYVDIGDGYRVPVPSSAVAGMDNEALNALLMIGMLPSWPASLANQAALRYARSRRLNRQANSPPPGGRLTRSGRF